MSDHRYDALLLENQLCFPLYACSREIIKRYRPYLDKLGLTYTQYITLMVIWAEGTVSVRDMGRRLYLDSGTLTPVLKSLEAKGFIRRYRCAQDERVLLAEITQEGLALRERALQVPAALAGCVSLTGEEAATLYQLLYKVMGEPAEK
ncbi:MAG: MarR family transcriptional regulator [Clostridia bacterium]|nr:MarR family transcriptional regulator [Clostridia bacterium]